MITHTDIGLRVCNFTRVLSFHNSKLVLNAHQTTTNTTKNTEFTVFKFVCIGLRTMR